MSDVDAIPCVQCKNPVEEDRRDWATKICHACLKPPKRLPVRHTDGCLRRMAVSGSCSCIKGGAS